MQPFNRASKEIIVRLKVYVRNGFGSLKVKFKE